MQVKLLEDYEINGKVWPKDSIVSRTLKDGDALIEKGKALRVIGSFWDKRRNKLVYQIEKKPQSTPELPPKKAPKNGKDKPKPKDK